MTILFLICITILWINSEPTIQLKRHLGFKEEKYNTYSQYKQIVHRLIYCAMCSGFYIGLIGCFLFGVTPMYSAIVAVCAEFFNRFMNKYL